MPRRRIDKASAAGRRASRLGRQIPERDGSRARAQQRRIAAVVEASEEKTVVVESPLYRVELSNRGGVVKPGN